MEKIKDVVFRIQRYNKEKGTWWDEYKIPVYKGMTILDGLIYIKENLDGTLTFRASCRMGACGSCAVFVNGKPMMACQTQILHLNSDKIKIQPLPNYPVIKDLVVDRDKLFENHKKVKPYLIREEFEENKPIEFLQPPEEHLEYLRFTYCFKCGACLSACPTCATDEEFLGPQALTQAYRYSIDTRDNGWKERIAVLDTTHGVWKCHFATACSDACPKGVDPALAIQLLKKAIIFNKFKKKKIAPKAPPYKGKRKEGIPNPPEPTV